MRCRSVSPLPHPKTLVLIWPIVERDPINGCSFIETQSSSRNEAGANYRKPKVCLSVIEVPVLLVCLFKQVLNPKKKGKKKKKYQNSGTVRFVPANNMSSSGSVHFGNHRKIDARTFKTVAGNSQFDLCSYSFIYFLGQFITTDGHMTAAVSFSRVSTKMVSC